MKFALSDDQKEKLKAAGKRAAWTVAQAAIAAIGTATVMSEVDWRYVAGASALAGILSLLKSVMIGMPEVE